MNLKTLYTGQLVLTEDDPIETSPEEGIPEVRKDTPENAPGEEAEVGPSVSEGYTLEMAHGQLKGVLKNWYSIAGKYETGDKRNKFLELGERIQEVVNKIEQDFLNE